MRPLLSLIFLLHSVTGNSQGNRQKLLVAEFRIDTPRAGNYTYLVSYNFENGKLQSKDTILGAETFKKDKRGQFKRYVRFEFGRNFIYNKRYVVSGTGNVIDIKEKKLVIEEGDNFIAAHDDTMIFHRANIFTGTGYLVLNLKTSEYRFLNHEERNRDKIGRSSPDQAHYLSIDRSKIPYKICLHDTSGQENTLVVDAGHGPNIAGGSQSPTVETHWLTNTTFLYTVHKLGGIDSAEFDSGRRFYSKFFSTVTIHHFDIASNNDTVFYTLDSVRQGDVNDRFFKDDIGQLIYRTSGYDYYRVDTVQKILLPYPFYELGNGFSFENKPSSEGNRVFHQGKEIGMVRPFSRVVGKGIIAFEQGENCINVWSERTQNWSKIDIPWISSLVGWIDEE